MEQRKDKTRVHEIVAYSITMFFWVGGLVLCCLGVYAFNGPGKISNNPIFQAQKGFTAWLGWSSMIDFRILGAAICLITMCIFLAFVYHFANKSDRFSSRKSRQLERLKQLMEQDKANMENKSEAVVATPVETTEAK